MVPYVLPRLMKLPPDIFQVFCASDEKKNIVALPTQI
jgi:hypothetical protein